MEHGITFADPDEGAFALLAPISGVIKDAVVRGYQMVLRSSLSYQAAARAMGPGDRAFEDATKYLVGAMLESVQKALEIECLYGQVGYTIVLNNETAASNVVVELTPSEFAPGIWAGAKGMPLDVVRSNALVPALSGTSAIIVKGVDLTAKTITMDLPANLVAGDTLFRKGAFGKEFPGIHKILTNTGTLFGIDASAYELWKGSEFQPLTTSVLSFPILQQAISKGVEKGLDSDVVACSSDGFFWTKSNQSIVDWRVLVHDVSGFSVRSYPRKACIAVHVGSRDFLGLGLFCTTDQNKGQIVDGASYAYSRACCSSGAVCTLFLRLRY